MGDEDQGRISGRSPRDEPRARWHPEPGRGGRMLLRGGTQRPVGIMNVDGNSDAMFWGEVVSVEEQEIMSSVTPFLAPITFDRGYFRKGVSWEQVIVSGQGSEAGCGLYFDEGETFLGLRVPHVGKGEDGPLKIGFCTASPHSLGWRPSSARLSDRPAPERWESRCLVLRRRPLDRRDGRLLLTRAHRGGPRPST